MERKDLKGHRAVITGASSGLGEEFAKQLAARGADLVIAARRLDRLESLAQTLSSQHDVRIEAVKSDLSQAGAATALFEQAVARDPVTLLINNAGIGPYGRFLSSPRSKHSETMQLNAIALTELCHLFAAHMTEHGRRSYIANIGSIASFQGAPNFAVYAGTKAYVRVFSEILAQELKDSMVSVTCVCPGGTYTEFSQTNGQELNDAAHSFMMTSEQVVSVALKGLFAGRMFVVPGVANKLACFLPRILPSGLSLTLAQLAMERSVSVKGQPVLPASPGKSTKS